MTREGILKHKEVFDAWLEGAEVECFDDSPSQLGWFLCPHPDFLLGARYRVKPQSQTRMTWVNIYPEEQVFYAYSSRKAADQGEGTQRIACVPVTITWTEGEGLE